MTQCDFRPYFDPITEEPFGPLCTNPAVERITWKDSRFSHACAQHGANALDSHGKAQVASIEALP